MIAHVVKHMATKRTSLTFAASRKATSANVTTLNVDGINGGLDI